MRWPGQFGARLRQDSPANCRWPRRASIAVAESLIPLPLAAAFDLCVLHVYHMHDAEWFGVYCESAWQIPVLLPDDSDAVYSAFLAPESDVAVTAGRESCGQPKKAGHMRLAAAGDLLVGVVARNGIDVATATMCRKQRAATGERARQRSCLAPSSMSA